MSPIREVQERYRELGRLRMGEKGEKNQPVRLDTWRLTSPSKALLEAARDLWGGEVDVWNGSPTEGEQFQLTTDRSSLPVLVPPQDIDSHQFYELWHASGIKRRCDGELDFVTNKPCPCNLLAERECKPTTHVKFFLPDIPDIGTWRLVTHGWNAAAELAQTMRMIHLMFPTTAVVGDLAIESRTSKGQNPKTLKPETHHFVVPVLRLPFSMGQLMAQQESDERVALGRGGRPALGDAPELPHDARFESDTPVGWGDAPALPSDASAGEPSVDLADGVAGASEIVAAAEGAGETTGGSGVTAAAPPESRETDDGELDEPAPEHQWAVATKHGIKGAQALRLVREWYEADPAAWPGEAPANQAGITRRQLEAVIRAKIG